MAAPRRRPLVVILTLALILAVGGLMVALRSEPTEKFCTADGRLGSDGEIYGRSHEHDCAFVDANGRPFATDTDGSLIIPE